jgi:hypothetical protein
MILRWLERSTPPGIIQHTDEGVSYVVLQVGVQEPIAGVGGYRTVWHDVPLEKERGGYMMGG